MRIKVKEGKITILYAVDKCNIGWNYDYRCYTLEFYNTNRHLGHINVDEEKALTLQEELFKNGYLDLTLTGLCWNVRW